jgi:ABC-type multidrug transport system ATPase subunit
MLIIDKGKKLVEGKVNDLFDPAETIVELKTTDDQAAWQQLQQSALEKYLEEKRNDCLLLKLHRNEVPGLMKELVHMDINVVSLHSKHSLEDYFLSLTSGKEYV